MKRRPYTEADLARLEILAQTAVSWADVARALDRPVDAVRMKASNLGIKLRAASPAVPEPIDPVEAERARRERLKGLREEREALTAVAGERSLRAMLERLIREVVPAVKPPPRYVPPKSRMGKVQESVILHWSDWHYGEVVKSERVRGFNAYDQEIATDRARSIVASARGILARLRQGGYAFPRAVIAANGDFVTGTIHELEKHSNGKTIVESVVECGTLLAESVRDVAADFERVDVFCTVGNHGRLPDQRRMEQKAPLRNWDALVYFFAQAYCRDLPNVSFTIPDSYAVGYEIGKLRVLQSHGHQVKSWMGIPWYGMERHVSRITALEARRNTAPDVYLFGHFHTATSLPHSSGESFINGSLIGGTEYSVNELGKADRPAQWLLGVHHEHAVTHRWPIYPLTDGPAIRGAA